MLVGIDADVLVYQCAFAAQKSFVTVKDLEGNDLGEYKNKTEAKKEHGKDIVVENQLILDPVEYCLHSIKKKIELILQRCKATEYKCFITGSGNFREKVLKPVLALEGTHFQGYKANRSAPKPVYYQDARDYLVNNCGAQIIEGKEADDELATQLTLGAIDICASIDKDLTTVPGMHFNWDKMKKPTKISKIAAMRFFYQQLIMGDKADNIMGCRGEGDRSPYLAEIAKCRTEKQMWDIVVSAYKLAELRAEDHRKEGGKWENHRPIKNIELEIVINARLLWMLREPFDGKLWKPPHLRDKNSSGNEGAW